MFKIIGSAEAKYLAATDILIGDMSNINYEFLLFNRPIILMANEWIKSHFPDIGIKINPSEIEKTIQFCIENPSKFEDSRKYWLSKTIFIPKGGACNYYIELSLKKANYTNPEFVLIDGSNPVRRTNLMPIFNELMFRKIRVKLVNNFGDIDYRNNETIFIGAHCIDLNRIDYGYSVHIDHDLKAPATANIYQARIDYKKNNYFNNIDLHITAGIAGKYRTQHVLGNNKDRVNVGGYAKADDLLSYDYHQVKKDVCKELDFDPGKPIITYAPAGKRSYMKPGGSFSKEMISRLTNIGQKNNQYNILIKAKYKKEFFFKEYIYTTMKFFFNIYRDMRYSDGGEDWDSIIKKLYEK